MATNPLFSADLVQLKKDLRLSGANAGGDFEAIYETAVLQARIGFNTRLGPARVAELVAINYTPNPTTENDILRALARVCEVRWVRLILIDLLPTIWMDASGQAQQNYNEEAAFRSTDTDQRGDIRAHSLAEIEAWLAILAGEVKMGDADIGAHVFIQDRPNPTPVPGESPWIESPSAGDQVFDPGEFDGNFVQ